MVTEPVEIAQVQLTDVRDPFECHDDTLETETPGEHGRLQTEGRRHLRPEDSASPEFHPPTVRGLSLGLHARLRVGEESRPELHAGEAEPSVERLDRADQLRQVRPVFHHDPFNLVELREVLPVDRIGTEVAADDERLLWRNRMLPDAMERDPRRGGPEGVTPLPP